MSQYEIALVNSEDILRLYTWKNLFGYHGIISKGHASFHFSFVGDIRMQLWKVSAKEKKCFSSVICGMDIKWAADLPNVFAAPRFLIAQKIDGLRNHICSLHQCVIQRQNLDFKKIGKDRILRWHLPTYVH